MRIHAAKIGRICLLITMCAAVSACETTSSNRARAGQTKLTPQQVQGELMAFADSYTALIVQAAGRMTRDRRELRAVILRAKLDNVQNAIIIAAGPNPVGGLLDMTVMVSLQRQVVEEYWVPEVFGEAGEPLASALTILEREIWRLVDQALPDESAEALRALIPVIRERFPGQVHVSAIRASDFAEDRQALVVNLQGGGNLLQLFQLDPLANLSPASQELAQTRLLAERGFFWAMRMPAILNWQIEDVILDTLDQPESQALVDASVRISEASAGLGDTAAEISEWLPEEREAAINQALDGLTREREAIVRTFENEEVRLRGLLGDVQQTVEATTTLSRSLTETVDATDRLVAGFRRDPDAEPPAVEKTRRPFDITDYQATAETVTETVRQLDGLVTNVDDFLGAPAWDDRVAQIQTALNESQAAAESLIDRIFGRAIVVVLLVAVPLLVARVGYRLIGRRIDRSLIAGASD